MIEALREIVLKVSDTLKKNGLKLAAAESCTGGGLCYWLTSVPGSSAWFERGFVTYSNEAKIDMLGVSSLTLDKFGAVSEQTAREMAEGALKNSRADVSIAITGIAGPDGGLPNKPVGTVWIAWSGKPFTACAEVNIFTGDRQQIRLQSIEYALRRLDKLVTGS